MHSLTANKQALTIEAPAKINLYLAVKGRRADGYHEIESLMHKIDLADHLHIRLGGAKGIRLTCSGAELPEDETNLAYRAARLFLEMTGLQDIIQFGVEIVLEKKIPVAAGLGGGSSDAAAVLRGLNSLFKTRLNPARLSSLARLLGADVSFFVTDDIASWATGIGDCLTPAASLGPCRIVLVNPGFAVATRWVYENLALTTAANPYILPRNSQAQLPLLMKNFFDSAKVLPLSLLSAGMVNDLEAVTIKQYPAVAEIKDKLLNDGACGVLMSGSGPTVFGLFAGHNEAENEKAVRSYKEFAQRFGNKVFLTRPCAKPAPL